MAAIHYGPENEVCGEVITPPYQIDFIDTSFINANRFNLLDTIPEECFYHEVLELPAYLFPLPYDAWGDTALAMRFDAGPSETLRAIEFFVADVDFGIFGDDDIYVTFYYDSAGYPGSEFRRDTIAAGTYPPYPAFTTLAMEQPVSGSFHVALSTSASLVSGAFEFFVMSDLLTIPQGRSTGSGSFGTTGWYKLQDYFSGDDYNIFINAVICRSQYYGCATVSCNTNNSKVWSLPDTSGNFAQAQRIAGLGNGCLVNQVHVSLTWPPEDALLPLYTDSAEIQVFDNVNDLPGNLLFSQTFYSSDFTALGLSPGAGVKTITGFFDDLQFPIVGDYWIGIRSFALNSTTGIRTVSDSGGGECALGFAQNSGSWEHVSSVWSLPGSIAMGAASSHCCDSISVLIVPTDIPTIQRAIDSLFDNDTVLVLPGLYREKLYFRGKDIVLGSMFLTTEDTAYIGNTIIESDSAGPAVNFVGGESRKAMITGFTIRNGVSFNAGAIYCEGSSPTISDNRIVDNEGGGRGGAIYFVNCGLERPRIENNLFMGNNALEGGAIYTLNCNCDITRNDFRENTAESGGACYFRNGNITIDSCVFYKNESERGAAVYCYQSNINLLHSTIVSNTASAAGILHSGISNFSVVHGIVAHNKSTTAIFQCEGQFRHINVTCTELFQNEAGTTGCESIHVSLNSNPLFCNYLSGDLRLNQYSPCLETSINCSSPRGALGVGCSYLCGDADGDGTLTLQDASYIQQYYLACSEAPVYYSSGDVNCDGNIDLADILHLTNHLLYSGPAPCCP